ncbi:hypothetical protein EYY93_14205 [Hafnia paralvei]|uniref:hypothetical protein n=1 Tax=Hafnia paralvei TaxID=546367 RepID=UPI001034100B|nr:hypothetical protein [Hafnia paralvei]TBL99724.1 hypothetical protein EYY93_14205 [Hafnia paralvei]
MRKILLMALFVSTSALASSQPTMYVFKCTSKASAKSTIVTWNDIQKEDGWHRYASWSDNIGQHSGIELYINSPVANDKGEIEDIFVFGNMDAKHLISGPSISMVMNKKAHTFTYHISSDSSNSQRNVVDDGSCVATDSR